MRIDYQLLDQQSTPLGTLELFRYHAQTGELGYEIRIDGEFLMASHGAVGERQLGRVAYDRLACARDALRVLVGGLGAGHTLRAVLQLPAVVEVTVVEIGSKVFEWNRRYFAGINGGALADPRVRPWVGDLRRWLERPAYRAHLALVDVDNGPGWLASEANRWLYGREGLGAWRDALVPGGVLAIWSPGPNELLHQTLAATFGEVDEVVVVEDDGAGRGLTDVAYCVVA